MRWEDGITLHRARFRYGVPELVRRYNEIQESQPGARMFEFAIEQFTTMFNPDDNSKPVTTSDPRFQEISALSREQREITDQLNSRLLGFLCRSQLIGLGYELPRTSTSVPVRIPPDVWTGHVKWEKGEVSGNKLAFCLIRIIKPEPVDQRSLSDASTSEPPKGRPSRKDQVEAAFWALDREGAIPDHPDNIKALFLPITRKIDELYPDQAGDESGLTDKTLYRYVSDLAKAKRLKSQ